MANRSSRGSEEPVIGSWRELSAMTWMGSDPRTSSGPAVMCAAPTGRTHDCTRPQPNHQKLLALRRPSTHAPQLAPIYK